MMTLSKVSVATLDELTDELGAAGWDSTAKDVGQARVDVVRLLCEVLGPPKLVNIQTGEVYRTAFVYEAVSAIENQNKITLSDGKSYRVE